MNNIIIVDTKENPSKFTFIKDKIIFMTDALIGRNGSTLLKKEGDGKTPIGTFELGIVFGTHDKHEIILDESFRYVKINSDLYWVDDIRSKYYNKLVNIKDVKIDWNSAEHLIDYQIQYEYAIEIKTNPENIQGRGSAIFVHCSNGAPTAGCISIQKDKLIELLNQINKDTKIVIK